MSRVGKLPIKIPQGIQISLEQLMLTISGPKGTLVRTVPEQLDLEVDQETIHVRRRDDSRESRSLHGR